MDKLNKADFKEAMNLDAHIKKIDHVLIGLECKSFYAVQVVNAGDNKSDEIDKILGIKYVDELNNKLIDKLKLKKLELVTELKRYIS